MYLFTTQTSCEFGGFGTDAQIRRCTDAFTHRYADTDIHTEAQTYTGRHRQTQTDTDRHRQRQADTGRHRHRHRPTYVRREQSSGSACAGT